LQILLRFHVVSLAPQKPNTDKRRVNLAIDACVWMV
jgi:hypothetical protein